MTPWPETDTTRAATTYILTSPTSPQATAFLKLYVSSAFVFVTSTGLLVNFQVSCDGEVTHTGKVYETHMRQFTVS